MSAYFILLASIILEVIGTLTLPATQTFTKLVPTSLVFISYAVSIYLLAMAVQKLPLSLVYASWAGLGVFSVAIMSYILYQESLAWQAIVGLFLIVIGVTLVNVFKIQS